MRTNLHKGREQRGVGFEMDPKSGLDEAVGPTLGELWVHLGYVFFCSEREQEANADRAEGHT